MIAQAAEQNRPAAGVVSDNNDLLRVFDCFSALFAPMTLQTLEPVLYLPDDTPFHADPGDVGHRVRLLWRAAGLLVLCFLAYLPVAIWGGLVWQDDVRVTQNIFLWGPSGLAGMWAHAVVGHYGPLAQMFLWAEHHYFGPHPLGYHLVSILLHGVNAGLLWMVLRRLGIRGAWLAAAVFALHPMQVQSVAWISQQSHLIGAGFALGAVWACLRFSLILPLPEDGFALEGEAYQWDDLLAYEPLKRLYAISLVLTVAACLSDPIGFVIPFALVLLIWWKKGTVGGSQWVALAPLIAIATAAMVLVAIMTSRPGATEYVGIGPTLSFVQRAMAGCRAVWICGSLVVWPYPLLFVYERWNVSGWWQLSFVFALAGVFAAGWVARKRLGRGLLVAAGLFVVALAPEIISAFSTPAPPIYLADHWAYLALAVPSALFAQALAVSVSWFSSAMLVRSLRFAVAVVSLGVLGFLTLNQGTIYDREESVWQDALYYQPTSSVALSEYTRLLLHQRRDGEAWALVNRARQAGQGDVSLLLSQAQVYNSRERYSEAIDCYRQALLLDPKNEQVVRDLADAYAHNGQLDEAMRVYSDAVKAQPKDAVSWNNMGLLLMREGKVDQAVTHYQSALNANPRFIPAMVDLAQAYETQARAAKTPQQGAPLLAKAAAQLQQIVAIDPRNFDAFYDSGVILFRLHDFADAEKMFAAAARAQPDNPKAWDRLGLSQWAQGKGRLSDAVWNLDHSVRLNPDNPEAQQHLEQVRRELVEVENAASSTQP